MCKNGYDPNYEKDFEYYSDNTGMMLNPQNPEKCLGNGMVKSIKRKCEGCRFYKNCLSKKIYNENCQNT